MPAKSTKTRSRVQPWAQRILNWCRGPVLIAGVAIDAFAGSYGHMLDLSGRYGQLGWHAYSNAALADTLCIIGAEWYRREKRRHQDHPESKRRIAYPAFIFINGVLASIYGNWETAHGAIVNHLFAVWPSYVLLIILGLIEMDGNREEAVVPAGTRGQREQRTGNPEHGSPGTGTGNPGTSDGNPMGTGTGNQPGGKPGTDERAGGAGLDRTAPPAPGKPEAIIPEGYVITAGPHTIEDEARAARAAVGAFLAANGKRPRADELGKMCCRRKSWAGPQLNRLRDVPDDVLLAEIQQEGAANSR
jgi:hypothetical protein